MEDNIKKKIFVVRGEKKRLGELFGVCQKIVRSALDGQSDTDIAIRIRIVAIKRGGVYEL